ncbi:MAG TPA: VWA domain-containing protein [Chloroflexota bacterium]|nr:VWA domain-containing protein [Chloroflexota bacterium]
MVGVSEAMTFVNPLLLLLIPLLLVVLWLAWRDNALPALRSRLTLVCRAAICTLLVLALAGSTIQQPVGREAVVFVADVSASTEQARAAEQSFISQAVSAKRPDDAYAVVGTARQAAVERVLGSSGSFDAFAANGPDDGTDLAAGLRLAGGLLPSAYRPRVVLLSDGQQTTGDGTGQARLLAARGVRVDVVPLAVSSGPEVLLDQLVAPRATHEGERFSVRVPVVSNVQSTGTVRLYRGDDQIGEQTVDLKPGTSDVTFSTQADQSGFVDLRATLTADADTLAENNAVTAVVQVQGPPRVMVIEGRDGEATAIVNALTSGGMQVDTHPPADVPQQAEGLGGYAAVVLADVSATSLDDAQQSALRSYVRDLGRGLLAIGGDTSFGQGDYVATPLDDVLPVRSSVRAHRDQGRVALVLVIDRSGSMADDPYKEGTTKLDMARQAAVLSVQELTPRDLVGVLAFDSFQHWLIPMASVASVGMDTLEQRIGALSSDGGTDIFRALSAGFDAAKRADAQYRHVILMSDGMSCCNGDYGTLLDNMHEANVTLSTIAVGGDADQKLLSQLARQGDGRYYFAEHARDIPRLMTRETNLATRGPLVEGNIEPRQVSPDATLSELASGGIPPLGGYLVTTPKDLAEVLLVSDAADPILARWPYGLGRAVAWTSDLRGRWSSAWLQWPGMPRLFNALVGWTIPPAQGPLQVSLRAAPDAGHITVETSALQSSGLAVNARLAQPGQAPVDVPLAGTGPGRYEGEFPLPAPGTYLMRVEAQRDGAPVAAADAALPVSYAAEFRRVSADPARMEQIARAGGGRVLSLDEPAAAFADDLAPVTSPLPLQYWLLLFAAVLLPMDVALRRLRISFSEIGDWLRHPRRLGIVLALPTFFGRGAAPSVPLPTWVPGMRSRPRPVQPLIRPMGSEVITKSAVTPALAREQDGDNADDDALAETLRWLAARRRGRPEG